MRALIPETELISMLPKGVTVHRIGIFNGTIVVTTNRGPMIIKEVEGRKMLQQVTWDEIAA